jgi:hypothetical protein
MDSESDSEAPGHTGSGPGQPEAGASGRGRRFKHGWWTPRAAARAARRAATAYTSKPRLGAAATESQPEADS